MARADSILDLLADRGIMSVKALAEHLDVNVSTMRRDLEKLVKDGKVLRTHGGAALAEKRETRKKAQGPRAIIGRAMADRILENQTVLIDTGKTCIEVAKAIQQQHVTVVTNDFNVAAEIAKKPQINLVFIGGELLPNGTSTWGPTSLQQVEKMRFNVGIFGAASVLEDGLYSHSSYSMELRQKMFEMSTDRFFVAESAQFGREALFRVFDISGFTAGITDSGLDPLTAARWPVPIIRASE